ncbi:uncharacterized protein LOC100193100 [Zea mays]|uniref:SHSP domain-containing protein n=3 Tax=Zea mays TaxID=4577 RepID=B8A1I4_MAIZE|nr:uncharacterized protein LOC100193100 [Zea mays]ACL54033.1 unknown [Zea mays]|eukprot:NP_001146453.1 uncharacterized protein LOC100193100 [Zea mays]
MASGERVYEDFKPPHKMEREPATHTLTVDLSAQGYRKEHIRVQMVHSHRCLIVRGERPVDGNRWSRFRLDLPVPDGCDAKAVHARFDNGVVRVTMPGVQQPEPVLPVVAGTADQQQQQQETPLPKHAGTAAAAGDDDVQGRKGVVGAAGQDGGDRDRAAGGQDEVDKHETPRKQEARQRVVSSAKHAGGSSGRGDDTAAGGVGQEVMAAASPTSSRQGYGFLHNRKKVTFTVLGGVALVLISLGIYAKYSLSP